MLSDQELHLKFIQWDSVIESFTGGRTNWSIVTYCKFLPGDPLQIHYEGSPKPLEDLGVQLYVFREYEKTTRIEPSQVQQIINPQDGTKAHLGAATLLDTFFSIQL